MLNTFLDDGDTSQCCGCSVCADSCSMEAISFRHGADGGIYPEIDANKCISCGACRRVCPIATKPDVVDATFEKKAYALMINPAALREKSASGGAFEAIATALHKQYDDLMIAGAAWGEDLRVYHQLVPYSEREVLKKSKYIQSNCSGIYREAKKKLNEGVHILFTGTPCQLAALKKYLGKEYDNLFLIDLICHGVPGEGIFGKYLDGLQRKKDVKVNRVSFRHKIKDFYGEVHSKYIRIELNNGEIIKEEARINSYLRGFHAGLFYRDSCYSCKFANTNRYGDITIGDYWRIQDLNSKYVDYSGVSCLLFNTKKGWDLFENINGCECLETDVEELYKRNSQLLTPSGKHAKHDYFMSQIASEEFDTIIDSCVSCEKKYKLIISAIIPGKFKRMIKGMLKK